MAVTTGPWFVARNVVRESRGSIHDDEEARRQGFAGGLVGGNVQYVFVTEALAGELGPAWLERGFLRFTWVKPVYDSEKVRIVLTPRASGELDFVLERRDATVVAAGFAGLGTVPPWKRSDAPGPTPTGDYDPLVESVGDPYDDVTFTPDADTVRRTMVGVEPHAWYADHWGRPAVASAGQVVFVGYGDSRNPREVLREMRPGMNARVELVHTGPMFLGDTYTRSGVLAEKGMKGRYAFRTIEFETRDAGGRIVNTFRWQIKWVTARPLA